ncbi:MAG: DUF4136 domain-containing protein [Deltaproteobacteria bacterium]|nr:DUF4136 domain-containing protein [Deltaproteobacteria bacterium]MBN2673082.1 DUF4136 domain-containing protein [Deltaproteobacteria bacterium]
MKKLSILQPIVLLAVTLGLSAVSGCSGEVFGSIDDYRAVVTIRADESVYDFSNIRTYQLPNTVLEITEVDQTYTTVDHARDLAILDQLRTELAAAGLTNVVELADAETGETPEPDVIFTAALVAQASWGLEGVAPWEELNRFAYYPSTPVEMSYPAESLIITMVSPNIIVANRPNFYYALWTAGVHYTYSDATEETVRNGIIQAFEQSPYIAAAVEEVTP